MPIDKKVMRNLENSPIASIAKGYCFKTIVFGLQKLHTVTTLYK